MFTKTFTVQELAKFKNILGVDIGSTNLATVVVYNPIEKRVIRSFYLGRDVAPKQRQFEIRRAKIQASRDKRKLNRISGDQQNFTKTNVNQIAHEIVSIAKQYNANIAIEDLNGFTNVHYTVNANRKIHRIPTRVSEVIGRVGVENGVPTLVVNPAYTSQDCAKCGHRHKSTGKEYRCPICGWTINRDLNASMNIALRATKHGIDQIVFGQKPKGSVAVTPRLRSDDGISSQLIHTSGIPFSSEQG